MFSAIRNRLHMSPAMALATVALVFAMTGGAYAASKYVITSTKQISPKVLKSLQGKAGKAGANGAAGAAGAAGPAGATGPGGAAGAKGENGAPGASGTTGIEGKAGKEGKEGKKGENGETGFTSTLPSGKTETGTWAEANYNIPKAGSEGTGEILVPISFPIPLTEPSEKAAILDLAETESGAGTEGCAGTVADPTAPAGTLCVYTAEENNKNINAGSSAIFGGEVGYQKSGTVLRFSSSAEPAHFEENGSWAVTAK